jgi:transketolase
MRITFAKTLVELAERDARVLLLTGDLGFMVLEPFVQRFPDRFFNMGVAEQNMIGVATGLAEAGFLPFVYSIATFATLRGYEFLRNGPALHQLPVRIVGVGGGFEYGTAGTTHYGLEDLGVLRLQPEMTVIAPADFQQARTALLETWDHPGPVYYRLGKDEQTTIPGLDGRFALGRAAIVRRGDDVVWITTGAIATEVTAAAARLAAREGVSSTVVLVASVSPPPVDDLVRILRRFPVALSVEAHYRTGGLGSLVAEIIADHGLSCQLERCGIDAMPRGLAGSQRFLQEHAGLSAERLAARVPQMVQMSRRRG